MAGDVIPWTWSSSVHPPSNAAAEVRSKSLMHPRLAKCSHTHRTVVSVLLFVCGVLSSMNAAVKRSPDSDSGVRAPLT